MIVKPRGPVPNPLMFVGEYPGHVEDRTGYAFTGVTGELLDIYCDKAGIYNPFRTNVLREFLHGRKPTGEDVDKWIPLLVEEIAACKPRVIVTLGDLALRAFFPHPKPLYVIHGTGIRYSLGDGSHEFTLVPSFNPAAGLHEASAAAHCYDDICYAKMLLDGKSRAGMSGLAVLGIDTEGTKEAPFCLSWDCFCGEQGIAMAGDPSCCTVHVDHTNVFAFHNGPWDYPVVEKGWPKLWEYMGQKAHSYVDTMIEAYLLDEPRGLKDLSYRWFLQNRPEFLDLALPIWAARQPPGKKKIKLTTKKLEMALGRDPLLATSLLQSMPVETWKPYALDDARDTRKLHECLAPRIRDLKLEPVLQRDIEYIPLLIEMKANGMRVDKKALGRLLSDLGDEVSRLKWDLIRGHTHNPDSPAQVSKYLYQTLGVPGQKKTKKGAESTDEQALQGVVQWAAREGKVEVVKYCLALQDYRELRKLQGTYVAPLYDQIGPDGKIHPELRNCVVVSGRLAGPILTIPVHSTWGKRVRQCYVADPGMLLGGLDISQGEIRVLAHESQDPILLDIIWNKGDFHQRTADGLPFLQRIPKDIVKKLGGLRQIAKTINFAILYGLTGIGLYLQLLAMGVSTTILECEGVLESWYDLYAGVKDYRFRTWAQTRRDGYVRGPSGRIRKLPNIWAKADWIRAAAEREAFNFVIQEGLRDIVKEIEIILFQVKDKDVDLILDVHDEAIWQTAPQWADDWTEKCLAGVRMIERSREYSVPLEATMHWGKSWGDLK